MSLTIGEGRVAIIIDAAPQTRIHTRKLKAAKLWGDTASHAIRGKEILGAITPKTISKADTDAATAYARVDRIHSGTTENEQFSTQMRPIATTTTAGAERARRGACDISGLIVHP
jgi:hypothetical protein